MAPQLNICIIDDDPIVQFTLRKQIEHLPVPTEIFSFLDGEQALSFFKAGPKVLPDIIFLDINMPILDGWGFMEQFAPMYPELNKEIPLYVLSSSTFEDDINKSKKYPMINDYLIKPLIGAAFTDVFTPLINKGKTTVKS
jgi:CheY-like chemotaxis protein